MNKHILVLLVTLAFVLTGCKQSTFRISGEITDAKGKTLYLEQSSLGKPAILDSVVLKENGHFAFKSSLPEYPDIYYLRVENNKLLFVVDSVENDIAINVALADFPLTENIIGSEVSKLIASSRVSLRNNSLEEHKEFAKSLILQNPHSMAAYYALYQQKNGQYVFNPYNQEDMPYYKAVATAFNVYMPNYYRSKALYNQVIGIINEERTAQNNAALRDFIENAENAFFDIVLPDENGQEQALSQYRGGVILLDFSAVAMQNSTAYYFGLKDLYNKYHGQGLNIYSVSADKVKLTWQESAQNLPWTTVRGDAGMAETCFTTYNVGTIPTMFLFNTKGEIMGRFNDFTTLAHEIEKLL